MFDLKKLSPLISVSQVLTLELLPDEGSVLCSALNIQVPDKHPQAKDFSHIQELILPGPSSGYKTIILAASNWEVLLNMLLLAEVHLRREPALRSIRMKIRTLLYRHETN